MSLCLNTALCLELIFLVRYPFERKEKRSRVYYIVSILVSIIISTIAILFPPTNFWIHLVNGLILGLTAIYILTFIASLIYCCKKLYGAGISKEVRRQILWRHVLTCLVFMICNTYLTMTPIIQNLPAWLNNYDKTLNTPGIMILKFLFASQGLLIPVLRLSEPYFFQEFSRQAYNYATQTKHKVKVLQDNFDQKFITETEEFQRSKSVV